MAFKAYIITYKVQGSDENLKNTIKSFGAWMGYFDNFFIIHTELEYNIIKSKLDSVILQGTDRILIAEVNLKSIKGWIPQNGWDWIKKQVEKTNN